MELWEEQLTSLGKQRPKNSIHRLRRLAMKLSIQPFAMARGTITLVGQDTDRLEAEVNHIFEGNGKKE